jgi:hypothetical protein
VRSLPFRPFQEGEAGGVRLDLNVRSGAPWGFFVASAAEAAIVALDLDRRVARSRATCAPRRP